MNNAELTKSFLASTDSKTVDSILAAIAAHYGITNAQALAEVTDPEAESLLDYLTGNLRSAVSLLLKRHNLSTR